MISHNAEFYEALCPEKWILESGRLTVMGAVQSAMPWGWNGHGHSHGDGHGHGGNCDCTHLCGGLCFELP
jgi:hypothetical protein